MTVTHTRAGMSTTVKQIWLLLGIIAFTGIFYTVGASIGDLAGDILRYSVLTFGVIAGLIAIYGADGLEKLL